VIALAQLLDLANKADAAGWRLAGSISFRIARSKAAMSASCFVAESLCSGRGKGEDACAIRAYRPIATRHRVLRTAIQFAGRLRAAERGAE
jgi:hypothetical protein